MFLLKHTSLSWSEPATALMAQIAALILTLAFAVPLAEFLGFSLPPLTSAFVGGAIAATVGRIAGLSPWWLAINLLFWPAIALAYSLTLPPVWFLAAFGVLLGLYWSVFRTRVPLYLTGSRSLVALARMLPCEKEFRFIDLGAGTGRVLSRLAKARPNGNYEGIETAPLPFLVARLIAAVSGGNWHVAWGDMWGADLGKYDVVYAYLSPAPMPNLLRKLRKELKPGAVFISNTFPVPEVRPAETVELPDIHRSTLYLYRYDDIIGSQKGGAE